MKSREGGHWCSRDKAWHVKQHTHTSRGQQPGQPVVGMDLGMALSANPCQPRLLYEPASWYLVGTVAFRLQGPKGSPADDVFHMVQQHKPLPAPAQCRPIVRELQRAHNSARQVLPKAGH